MLQSIVEKIIIAIISAVISGIIAYISRRKDSKKAELEDIKQKYKALEDGTCALLRAEIIRSYDKYTAKGNIPIYASDALDKIYNAYHSLGGNGTMTRLYEELKKLSTN